MTSSLENRWTDRPHYRRCKSLPCTGSIVVHSFCQIPGTSNKYEYPRSEKVNALLYELKIKLYCYVSAGVRLTLANISRRLAHRRIHKVHKYFFKIFFIFPAVKLLLLQHIYILPTLKERYVEIVDTYFVFQPRDTPNRARMRQTPK